MTAGTDNPGRKYGWDATVGFASKGVARFPAADLHRNVVLTKEEEKIIRDCHIYFICRQPFYSFDPNDFRVRGNRVQGRLVRKVAGKIERFPFSFDVEPTIANKIVVAPYPHRSLLAPPPMNTHWPASFVAAMLGRADRNLLKFEVLYVGQAFGREGDRDAMRRLGNHETLQKILAVGATDFPDDEISIVTFAFDEPRVYTITDDRSPAEDGLDHLRNIMENPLSKAEQVSLIEAGLIRYFKPEYNNKLKETFPSDGQKLLARLYATDIAGLVVEINTEDAHARLWSPTRGDGEHHIATFDLHDPRVRQSFFTMTDAEGQVVTSVESGPIF